MLEWDETIYVQENNMRSLFKMFSYSFKIW